MKTAEFFLESLITSGKLIYHLTRDRTLFRKGFGQAVTSKNHIGLPAFSYGRQYALTISGQRLASGEDVKQSMVPNLLFASQVSTWLT
jgi:hypothetical protein